MISERMNKILGCGMLRRMHRSKSHRVKE